MANAEAAAALRNKKGTISTFDGLLDALADSLDPTDTGAAEKRDGKEPAKDYPRGERR